MVDFQASNQIQRRAIVLAIFLVIFYILMLARLVLVSTRDHQLQLDRAASVHRTPSTLPVPRGTIFDRNGNPLVSSALWYRISLDTKRLEGDPAWAIDMATRLFGKQPSEVEAAIEAGKRFNLDWFASTELKDKLVREYLTKPDGKIDSKRDAAISSSEYYGRTYGDVPLAPQLVGFLNADGVPQSGLEFSFDELLSGRAKDNANVIVTADGTPLPVAGGSPELLEPGQALMLTLDDRLQQLAQDAIAQASSAVDADFGLVLVGDPRTGELLAWAQWPSFDPRDRSTMLDRDHLDDKLDPRKVSPLLNYAINWSWEPGSFIKPITIASALEEGKITSNTPLYCSGRWSPDGVSHVSCYHHKVHGAQTPTEVIANSCNVGAAQVAIKLGGRALTTWFRRFGLDQAPAMDAGKGLAGLIGNPERMYPLDVATLGFGQGQVRTTPMQLFAALSSLANGGSLMQPYVVGAVLSPEGKVVKRFEPVKRTQTVSSATANAVLAMMRKTVTSGTASNMNLPGLEICGKTSTAEVSLPGKGYLNDAFHRVVGFFGVLPLSDPQLAIMIVIKYPKDTDPSGSKLAGPVFKELAQQAVRYLRISPAGSGEAG